MSSPRSINPYLAIATWPGWTREATLGFVYWVAFLLVLEPDNLLRASQAGHPLRLGNEVMRILVASLLGAAVTPALLSFSRRFPMNGPTRVRNALIHSLGMSGLALLLIVVSCFLAAWGFYGMWLPSLADIESELVSNWLLLIYALAALTALAHAGRRFRQRTDRQRAEPPAIRAVSPDYLAHVEVKARGRTRFVNLQEVDWVETQGNYLALHVGETTHLIREASIAFEAKLDPARFLRVHRRAIVALDRIKEMQPVTNGDALLRLVNGQELRASRRYRKILAQRWRERAPAREHAADA